MLSLVRFLNRKSGWCKIMKSIYLKILALCLQSIYKLENARELLTLLYIMALGYITIEGINR